MSESIPVEEIEVLPPLLVPLDAWHEAQGARMVEFAGYRMPVQYEGIIVEHTWVRENAGLFDVSHMGQLLVSGESAEHVAKALEALLPSDLAGLQSGRLRYSYFLSEEGGMLDDLMVTRFGDDYGLIVNGAMKWEDIGHLREYLPDDITLNHLDEHGLLALQGPKAVDVLERLVAGVSELKFMQAARFHWGDVALDISRSGYTGEDGFEISVPAESIAAFADALIADEAVKPIGLGARDSLRLEAGLPLYGHDMNEEIDPISASLGFAISKRRRAEGGFLGAEPTLKAIAEGTARVRIGLSLEGRQAAREGALIFAGETQIGVLTSGGFCPTLGHPIAMGYVDRAHAEVGGVLAIENRGKKLPATVVAMPFRAHRYYR